MSNINVEYDMVEEAICGAGIEVSRLRDIFESVLDEYFKLLYKEDKTEEENARLCELENMRSKINDYIKSIVEEFKSMFIDHVIQSNKKT